MKKLTYEEHMDLGVKLDDCRKTVFELYRFLCEKHGSSTVAARKLDAAYKRILDARNDLSNVVEKDFGRVSGCDVGHCYFGIKNRETP